MPRRRILVVDDVPEMRDLCQAILETRYDVESSGNAQEAMDIITSSPPDLILMDIKMPGTDGLSLCESLKSSPEYQNIPIILMTASTANSGLPPGFWKIGTPADGFLTKPFETHKLLQETERLLTRKKGIIPPKLQGGGGFL
ncbi:MAG TPA: response regulator [Candidatus Sumerlaeota bacterium]|nr:response regulator [Candidatus Sumerlaeota bacterium]